MSKGKKRGSARMRENGLKQVSLWLDPTEYAAVQRAARQAGVKVATWCRDVAVYRALGLTPPANLVGLADRSCAVAGNVETSRYL